MRQRIISMLVVTALFLGVSGARAADELTIVKQLDGVASDAAGTVEYTIADGVCRLVVTPAEGNYITHRRIWGEKVVSGDHSQSRALAPDLADTIRVTPVAADYDSTAVATFTFTMPADVFRVRLTVNFGALPYVETYPLWVGSIRVNADNCTNILGGDVASVSFDAERNLLVLENARLEGMPVRSNLDSLVVYLLGENTISADQTALFVNSDATQQVPLRFSTDANVPGTLTAVSPTGLLTEGFQVTYEYNLTAIKTDDTHYEIKVPIKPAEFDIENYDGEEAQYVFTAEKLQQGDDDVDLSNAVIDGVLYTLSDYAEPDGSGFDDGTTNDDGPGIVLNTEMTPDQMEAVQNLQPGTTEFANGFAGMTVSVPAGMGHFYVDAATEGSYALGIRVGSDEPIIVSSLSKGDIVTVNYATPVPCYVFIYNAGTVSDADEARPWRGGKKTATCVKVYGVSVDPDVLMGVNSPGAMIGGESDPCKVVNASSCYSPGPVDSYGGYDMSEVLGKTVTDLGDNPFDGIDMTNVNYVDLSKSKVSGLTVNRASGQFAGIAQQTLIFLPEDNQAGGEANVVIGDVCNHLSLNYGDDSFLTPHDFTAVKFDFGRTFTTGQPTGYYLPLELTAAQAATLGTFHIYKEVSGQQALFDKALTGGIRANHAYVFVPRTTRISLDNVAVKARSQLLMALPGGLYGTYNRVVAQADDAIYRMESANGGPRFVRLAEGESVSTFDTYLVASGAADNLEVVVDGVTAIRDISVSAQDRWYTIDGLRLDGQPLRKGLYIRSGRKVVVQ